MAARLSGVASRIMGGNGVVARSVCSSLRQRAVKSRFKSRKREATVIPLPRESKATGNMEMQNEKEGERSEVAAGGKEGLDDSKEKAVEMSRKEKRKAMNKMKRKLVRKEIASKEREEAEAKLKDPAEQKMLKEIEEEEARMREKVLKDFEESERVWGEAREIKKLSCRETNRCYRDFFC